MEYHVGNAERVAAIVQITRRVKRARIDEPLHTRPIEEHRSIDAQVEVRVVPQDLRVLGQGTTERDPVGSILVETALGATIEAAADQRHRARDAIAA